jgi:hypothetical protein
MFKSCQNFSFFHSFEEHIILSIIIQHWTLSDRCTTYSRKSHLWVRSADFSVVDLSIVIEWSTLAYYNGQFPHWQKQIILIFFHSKYEFIYYIYIYIFHHLLQYCDLSSEIIQSLVYSNYDDFQHVNFIFSQ